AVEHRRLAIAAVDPAHGPARDGIGQQAEVAPARGGQVDLADAHRAGGNFRQAVRRAMGEARRLGHAVVVVPHRIDAGAVAMAGLGQHAVRPEIVAPDREAGRAITDHGLPGDVLEQLAGADQVIAQLGLRLPAGALVRIAVAGELMPLADDRPDHLRVALRDPAEGEERRLDPGAREEREDALDIAFDPARQGVPLRGIDPVRERRDLEVVLHIDRERIDDVGPGVRRRRLRGSRIHSPFLPSCGSAPSGGESRSSSVLRRIRAMWPTIRCWFSLLASSLRSLASSWSKRFASRSASASYRGTTLAGRLSTGAGSPSGTGALAFCVPSSSESSPITSRAWSSRTSMRSSR